MKILEVETKLAECVGSINDFIFQTDHLLQCWWKIFQSHTIFLATLFSTKCYPPHYSDRWFFPKVLNTKHICIPYYLCTICVPAIIVIVSLFNFVFRSPTLTTWTSFFSKKPHPCAFPGLTTRWVSIKQGMSIIQMIILLFLYCSLLDNAYD